MACAVKEENIRLHKEDAISTKLWVDRLKVKNTHIFYKDKLDPPPSGSKLQGEDFIMCIQTTFQADVYWHLRNGFISIDVPHDACFIHDSCFCEGSGSFPPVKPQRPSWAKFSYDWYCELAASLSLHPHSLLPHFGSEVEPDVMFFRLSDPPS